MLQTVNSDSKKKSVIKDGSEKPSQTFPDNALISFLTGIPLFCGADKDLLREKITVGGKLLAFRSAERVNGGSKTHLGIIISGRANVWSADAGREVILRSFGVGDVFGITSAFGENEKEVSRIIAASPLCVLFITDEEFSSLLTSDRTVMFNCLHFLTGRIRFLNKRIACFTAGSAERRLALFLDSLADENGSDTATPNAPLSTLAIMLNIGRASLYRAIDCLIKDGFIEKCGKSFLLKDRKSMLNKYNK